MFGVGMITYPVWKIFISLQVSFGGPRSHRPRSEETVSNKLAFKLKNLSIICLFSLFSIADPVPKDKGYTAVFEYIKNNLQSENCVREAFKYLEELSQSANKNSVSPRSILNLLLSWYLQKWNRTVTAFHNESSSSCLKRLFCILYLRGGEGFNSDPNPQQYPWA